jgi:hypothetical protein
MSKRKMGRKRWIALREEIQDRIEGALDCVVDLEGCTFADKLDAAGAARDAVLKSLYMADAIEPPEGIDPS